MISSLRVILNLHSTACRKSESSWVVLLHLPLDLTIMIRLIIVLTRTVKSTVELKDASIRRSAKVCSGCVFFSVPERFAPRLQ